MAPGDRRGRVVALGQRAAGDDAAGLEVLEALRRALEAESAGPELVAAADASELLELLRTPGPIWLVDALVGAGSAGQVLSLSVDQLSRLAACSVSSHGLSAAQAIELCCTLYPQSACPDVRIRAITIEAPRAYRGGLAPEIAGAAARAAALIRQEWKHWRHEQALTERGRKSDPS